jgi:hypothetical protein
MRTAHGDESGARRLPIAKHGEPILLPVAIGSITYAFLLDTGSARTSFDRSLAHLLGEATRSVNVMTQFNGRFEKVQFFRSPEMSLAGMSLTGVSEIFSIDYAKWEEYIGHPIAGVLGMDAIRKLIVQIDFDRGQLSILRSVPHDAGRAVALDYFFEVPFARFWEEGAELPEIYWVDTGLIGLGSGTLSCDRFRSLLGEHRLSLVGRASVDSALGSVSLREGKIDQFKFAGFGHDGLFFLEAAYASFSLDYLSRYVVTFDFPGERLYLAPGKRFGEPDLRDLSGMTLHRIRNETLIESLKHGGAAETAGLHEGDIILEVEGSALNALTMLQIRRLLAVPSKRLLMVRRGEDIFRVELELCEADPSRLESSKPAAK